MLFIDYCLLWSPHSSSTNWNAISLIPASFRSSTQLIQHFLAFLCSSTACSHLNICLSSHICTMCRVHFRQFYRASALDSYTEHLNNHGRHVLQVLSVCPSITCWYIKTTQAGIMKYSLMTALRLSFLSDNNHPDTRKGSPQEKAFNERASKKSCNFWI